MTGDPPIIVTGGGGGESVARNNVQITFTDPMGRSKTVKAKNNVASNITDVVVKVSGQNSGGPVMALPDVTLSGFEFYNITIEFNTP
ncbi:MAG TPA: hypothetical protein VJT09_15380 [Pyrinomonadaceae bacterium]|nr:hypothetical protein [Pyrinomonadaceae bacterium]